MTMPRPPIKAGAGIVALQADQHGLADAARADHRGDDDHRQRHDDRLVDALHDRGQGERDLDAGQDLAKRRAEGAACLDHRLVDLADAEVGQADERRRRIDDRGEDGRHLAKAEEHRGRDQIDEARDGLHQVEDRIDCGPGHVAARGEDADRDAEEDGKRDRDEHDGDGLHRLVPEAEGADEPHEEGEDEREDDLAARRRRR